jgi:glycosyltransferase involved in cell wall biosynthesis
LKKIIILSEFFPPCNLTPSERIASFAQYLHEWGFYPIVVTRNWDIPIQHSRDEHLKTGSTVLHKKYENYEVYYMPYKPTLKSRLFHKFSGTPLYFLYLATALVYSVLENFSTAFTSHSPLYKQCKKIIEAQTGISLLLVSGSPFHLFKFGYYLHKKFGIKWVADYRDDWTTNELAGTNAFKKITHRISQFNEKKWVGTASFFISVSDFYVQKIGKLFPDVPGYTILNGFITENYTNLPRHSSDGFNLTNVGSLYPTQSIDISISAYKTFIDSNPGIKSKFTFVGLKGQPKMLEKVLGLVKGYVKYFEFTFRLPKQEAINIQNNSSVLLICAYKNLKGIPGSKLYEFIALKKPVLICDSDGEIIEATLKDTGQAYIANTKEDAIAQLNILYKLYGSGFTEAKQLNPDAINKYSRHENARKLAELLNKL